jgi:radical SAM protein with 4Fe4S-binding SPASM domain
VDCDNKVKDFKEKEVHKEFGYLGHCDQLYSRMIVLSNGDVALCCADDNGRYNLGNVLEDDPMEIYNNPMFTYYRKMNKEMRLLELDLCKTCTIPKSQQLKDEVE